MTPPVTRKRGVAGGLYRVSNSGVTVRSVVGLWMAGYHITEIVREYPHLTADQIEDALRWWSTRPAALRLRIRRGRA